MTTKTLSKEVVSKLSRNLARTIPDRQRIREINEARAEDHITQAESDWLAHEVQKDIDQKLGQTW